MRNETNRIGEIRAIAAASAAEFPAQQADGFCAPVSQAPLGMLLPALLASGAKAAAAGETGRVVARYWMWLPQAGVAQRESLSAELGRALAEGRSTPRAWVPVILGDVDFGIVHAATAAYLGARPASVDRLQQRVTDALDWVRRGLALAPAAVFTALLEVADEDLLGRLAPLRWRLGAADAATVWERAAVRDESAAEFIEEWRAAVG